MTRLHLTGLCLALSTCLASAELVFEKERIVLKPAVDVETVTAKFEFTYSGERPIVVEEVNANCGCIRAESDKMRYVKGDKGEITFVFELGSKEGQQSNRVWMAYREENGGLKPKFPAGERGPSGEDPNAVFAPIVKSLQVEIDIPIVVRVEPKMTKWVVGSKPEPREVTVAMQHLTPVHLKSAKSSREDVKVEIKEVKAGELYVVTLTPQSTEKKRLGMLTLETDSALPRHRKKLAFFSVVSPDAIEAPAKPQP